MGEASENGHWRKGYHELSSMTPIFLSDLLVRLSAVATDDDVDDLHRWIWLAPKHRLEEAVEYLNSSAGLEGLAALKSDLLCLGAGTRRGVVVLAANPGWREDLNRLEERYARKSSDHYVVLMRDFFTVHSTAVKVRVRWWSGPMRFMSLLPDGEGLFSNTMTPAQKWASAATSRMLGGWQLIPFHSRRDHLTQRLDRVGWAREYADESVRALLRLGPKLIVCATKSGWETLRNRVLRASRWLDCDLANARGKTSVSYTHHDQTEVVAVGAQFFAAQAQTFKNQDLFEFIRQGRGWAVRDRPPS